MPAPSVSVQVVHDVAAADDQHAGVAQRPQPLADLIVKLRRARFVDAQLYDRYVRIRENMAQHGPRAVIQAPARSSRRTSSGASSCCTSRCESGISRRRILDGEQLARKAAEIVDRARLCHRRHGELRQVPVRRNAQHRARPRQALRRARTTRWRTALFPSAFMGLPWPKKIAGRRGFTGDMRIVCGLLRSCARRGAVAS